MTRALAAISAMTLLAMPAFAQPPSLQADYDALLAAERGFSKLSVDKGVKEAFITHIADEGILFRGGGPVKGKEWTAARPNPPFTLVWWPEYADIAGSGDLGWTTGPFESEAQGEKGYGHYLTVWKKQADGNWRFLIDSGIGHEKPANLQPTPNALKAGKTKAETSADAAAGKTSLLAADRELGQATAQGTTAAYTARLADDAILMRDGAFPHVGGDAARAALAKEPAAMTSQPTEGDVSAAGDLGYTYGTAEWKDGEQTVKANYMRIWDKRDGAWKLRVDLVSPIPPPPPAPKPAG